MNTEDPENHYPWRLMFAALLCLLARGCSGTEYSFAPNSPPAFKQLVRHVLDARTSEVWTETRTIGFWKPGPVTFQSVDGGNIGGGLDTQNTITRGWTACAWIFHGSRTYLCFNRAAGSSHSQIAADITAEVTYWETH